MKIICFIFGHKAYSTFIENILFGNVEKRLIGRGLEAEQILDKFCLRCKGSYK